MVRTRASRNVKGIDAVNETSTDEETRLEPRLVDADFPATDSNGCDSNIAIEAKLFSENSAREAGDTQHFDKHQTEFKSSGVQSSAANNKQPELTPNFDTIKYRVEYKSSDEQYSDIRGLYRDDITKEGVIDYFMSTHGIIMSDEDIQFTWRAIRKNRTPTSLAVRPEVAKQLAARLVTEETEEEFEST